MKPSISATAQALLGGANSIAFLLGIVMFSSGIAVVLASSAADPAHPLPGAMGIATAMFAAQGIGIAATTLFNLLAFSRNARGLRLPDHRRMSLWIFATLLLVAVIVPGLAMRWYSGSYQPLCLIAAASAAGALLCLPAWWIWQWRVARSTRPSPARLAATTRGRTETLAVSRTRSPTQAMRVIFGGLYAPGFPGQRPTFAALLVALWCVGAIGLLVTRAHNPIAPPGPPLFVAWWLVFALLSVELWASVLSRALQALGLGSRQNAAAELALLPGLGSGPHQRRSLHAALTSAPAVVWVGITCVGCLFAVIGHAPPSIWQRFAMCLIVVPLMSGSALLGHMVKPATMRMGPIARSPRWWAVYLTVMPTYICIVFGNISAVLADLSALTRELVWPPIIMIAFVALVIVVPASFIGFYLHRLARRPHPFVEIS